MLYPLDPSSSSSKVLELRADERNSEQLKLQEVDPVVSFGETQIPNFCIRDYAFASRSKNNGASWPFPHRLLKLCLKHGIRDPLPPFEPASSVRDLFIRTSAADSEKIIEVNFPQVEEICALDGDHNPTRALSSSPSDDKFLSCANEDDGHCSSEEDEPYNLVNEDYELGSTLTNQCDIGETAAKKCSLILKPGVISETNRAEEIASNSTASDLMASKVCPVCKTFSSTSNTTLNAHMDQCLSMAPDATKIVDKIPKIVVKPTKKRLMEDIYATAPHCSLEDLDRRNGTSWATDLTSVIPPTEANSEARKLKASQADGRDDRSEGAVYVDSNGIKVRILSKFNDSPQIITSKKVFRPTSLIRQKKHFVGDRFTKKVMLKMKNKKLSSLKLLKNEAEPEIAHNEESHEEEESADKLPSQQEQARMCCGTSTLQKWHCSKRSDLPKKICKTNFLKSLENPGEFMAQMTNPEKTNSASGTYSSAKRHFSKLSHAPESKIADFSANTPLRNMANEVKGSPAKTNVLRLKLSKASGASVLSKSCRNGDALMGRKQKSLDFLETDNRFTENCNLSLKTKKISTLSKSKLRKREISSNSNEEQQILDEEDRSLHSGSCQCQEVKTKTSASQTENMGFTKFTRASSEKVDGSSIIAKSVNGETLSDIMFDSDDQVMPMEDCGISMERALLGKQDEKTSDKLGNRGVESQTGATSTESSACLTSHGDLGPDTPRQNCCSIASAPLAPNQESNLAINGEPSGSPVSSSSSPASPNNSLSTASDRELVSKPSATHGHLGKSMADYEGAQDLDIGHNLLCNMDSTMNKQQQHSDYHPCCCSRQSLMASTMPASKPKLIPNLHVRPCLSSIWHTETGKTTSLESPTESIMTRCCSVVGSTSPSCGTPSQSSSNSIIRLMGKNLMVTHSEESSDLLKVDSPAKDNISAAQSLASPLRFTSYVGAPLHESFPFAVCSPAPMMRATLLPVPVPRTMFQGPHPYFSQRNQVLLREMGSTSSYRINEGSSLEVPATIFPRPVLFRPPSATRLNPPLFYPQSLR